MCGEFLKCPQVFDFSEFSDSCGKALNERRNKAVMNHGSDRRRERFPEVWCLLAPCFGFSARRPLLLVFTC